jgi:hypothetical protein
MCLCALDHEIWMSKEINRISYMVWTGNIGALFLIKENLLHAYCYRLFCQHIAQDLEQRDIIKASEHSQRK